MEHEATTSPLVIDARLLWAARILNGAFLLASLVLAVFFLGFTPGPLLGGFLPALFLFIQWGLRKNQATKSALAVAIGTCSLLLTLEALLLRSPTTNPRTPIALWAIMACTAAYLYTSIKMYYLEQRASDDKRMLALGVLGSWIWIGVFLRIAVNTPSFVDGRIPMNEYSATRQLETISKAEATYKSTYPSVGFTCKLKELGDSDVPIASSSTSAALIDKVLADGVKSGYRFTIFDCDDVLPHRSYQVSAEPTKVGTTGKRAFCSDESGVIRYSKDGIADHCFTSGTLLH